MGKQLKICVTGFQKNQGLLNSLQDFGGAASILSQTEFCTYINKNMRSHSLLPGFPLNFRFTDSAVPSQADGPKDLLYSLGGKRSMKIPHQIPSNQAPETPLQHSLTNHLEIKLYLK